MTKLWQVRASSSINRKTVTPIPLFRISHEPAPMYEMCNQLITVKHLLIYCSKYGLILIFPEPHHNYTGPHSCI